MNRWERTKRYLVLSSAVALWLNAPLVVMADNAAVTTDVVHVQGTWAEEEAKLNPQQVQIITKKEIEKKQAKSVEDIIFTQTGVSRTVDAMGRVGVSIRGAEARHTLILVDGQPVLGDFDKYSGAADEVQRLGAENVERIEVIQGAASAKYGSDAVGGVVNIITKKALKKPTLQVNAEGMRRKSDGDLFPFQNFYIRADSGQMGKLKVGLSGSKRDLMPVLASVKRRASGMGFDYAKHNFKATDTNANLCIIAIPYGTSPIIGLTKPIPTCSHRFIQASYGDIPFFNTSSKINRIKALMVKSFRL